MCANISYIEFIEFDFAATSVNTEVMGCDAKFSVQVPKDHSLLTRAIVVSFGTKSESDAMHFRSKCRVVFSFNSRSEIPDAGVMADKYYKTAYRAFCEKTNEALKVLGHHPLEFPDI